MFPVGILGVLLLFAGIKLAMCARDMNSKEDSFVALICTAVSLLVLNLLCVLEIEKSKLNLKKKLSVYLCVCTDS